MSQIVSVHHVAIICTNYAVSKTFYTQTIGLEILREVYREARQSYKLDLAIGQNYVIELFSFPDPPARPSRPEAAGLRHLCFGVDDIEDHRNQLIFKGVACEDIRIDEYTGKKFYFISDPDGLPIEFYEV